MIKVASKLKIYLYSSLILTAAAIVLCSLCYLFAFDRVGYFSESSPLPYIFSSLVLVSAIFFLTSAVFIPKNALDGATPTTLAVNIASIPACAFSIILGFIFISAHFSISPTNIFGELFPSFVRGNIGIFPISSILLVAGIFLVISAIYFAFTWGVSKDNLEKHALLGFALPIAALFLIGATYFDLYLPMNSPIKLSLQASMLSFMIFSLYEIRVPLKKAKPRAYFAFAMLSVMLSGIASIPLIVAFIAGILKNTTYLIYAIFTLGIFIYIIARLCIFVFARSLLERISYQTPTEAEFPDLSNDEAPEESSEDPTEVTDETEEAEIPDTDQTEE